ncbi:MAG: hypothetical protein KatS3mg108_3185 [Isosphaeraceae bacterium]|jgi:HlyD family secretion protein|nr:MAG: hypothetical protein KatS3mg108_3185 [Isosphaeraceae bacterium]
MSPSTHSRIRAFLVPSAALGIVAAALVWGGRLWGSHSRLDLQRLPIIPVERTDLHTRIVAAGEVDSAEKTLVECELESLSIYSDGRSFSAAGSSRIIELIPEGSLVKKGDVLCRLDSSDFEEMVRQQEIKVLQARADFERARYELDAAEMALLEYREGLLEQEKQQIEAQRRMAQADIQRARDRLEWSRRMLSQGFISEGQVLREETNLLRADINLQRLNAQERTLLRYEAPATITRLEIQRDRARNELRFQQLRLTRREEQLARFRKQVENCTIRAPHDGMLIYANERDRDPRIEVGATVYQKMDLFYLPDFSNMEVLTVINETRVSAIEPGMPALIRVETLADQELEGHVISVSPMPIQPKNWRAQNNVRNYLARIKIHHVPPELRPGMSAQVEVITAHHPQALVIPTTAVAVENGSEYCYVPVAGGLERRPILVEPGTTDYVRVVQGLSEGEPVVADSSLVAPEMPVLASTSVVPTPASLPDWSDTAPDSPIQAALAH